MGVKAGMTGTDKIVEQILDEARGVASRRQEEARQTAADRLAEAEAAAKEKAAVMLADGEEEAERVRRTGRSAAALLVRSAGLRQRRQALDQTLAATLAYLNALPDEAYFERLYALLARCVQPGEGILRLNARDLARKPADFEQRVRGAVEAAGVAGHLTLSGLPCAIDGGLRLQYGEVEVNASFSALAEERREMLEDRLNGALFEA